MGFMQPQVYKDSFFRVETTAGTEIVPSDVQGRTVATHVDAMLDYLEGAPIVGRSETSKPPSSIASPRPRTLANGAAPIGKPSRRTGSRP